MDWDQLKTILWLRWRLTCNQWRRTRGVGAVISIIVAVALSIGGVGTFLGGLLAGIFGLGKVSVVVIWGVWSGVTVVFLFFWMIGLLQELQRSETIDLQKLMHLPVNLGQMFIVNYVASHFAASIIIMVPGMIGLTIGLVISRGPLMILLGPLALCMVFMITAWTYCLRGWLATLISNPRKRRTVTTLVTIGFILLVQGPNLYFNVLRHWTRPAPHSGTDPAQHHSGLTISSGQTVDQMMMLEKFIPPFWLPVGAQAIAMGNPLPSLLGTVGCLVLGALGLRRAYTATQRFYRGESDAKAAVQSKPSRKLAPAGTPAKAARSFLELQVPAIVPEQAVATALATFRSLTRAPEVKIALGSSLVVTLILGFTLLFQKTPNLPDVSKPFIATGAMVFTVFLLVQFFANQFGFDRDGFRSFILSPVDRKLILLGKNLASLPVGLGFGVALLLLISIRLRLSPIVALSALFQLATLLMLAGLVGNLLSILVPYRIQPGSMKPTKMPGLAMLMLMLSHMLFPFAMALVFIPPGVELLCRKFAGLPDFLPVNLILSVLLTALMGFVYWQTLDPIGRLLQRRETKILSVVTVEVE